MSTSIRFVLVLQFAMSCCSFAHSETITIRDAQLRLVKDVRVSTQEAGIVKNVPIQPNDVLKRDDLLVELDNEIQKTQVSGAEKQLSIAKAESTNDVDLRFADKSAEVAGTELERARGASARYSRAVSQTEIARLTLQFEQAQLSGEQARHDLALNRLRTESKENEYELAKIKLRQRTIRTPIDGQVAEVFVQEGEWAELGAPIARIVNLDKLRVVALVPEEHLFAIQKGQQAQLKIAIGRTTRDQEAQGSKAESKSIEAKGEVSFVSAELNPVNREFVIWVDIDNRDKKLRPGLVGTLELNESK